MIAPTPAPEQLAAQLAQATAEILKWHEHALELEAEIRSMRRREQTTVLVKRTTWPDSPEQLAEEAAQKNGATSE